MQSGSSNLILMSNLKKLREKTGYSQELVAKYLGTPRETISFYENGMRPISAPHVEKLADLFRVDTKRLKQEELDVETLSLASAFRADGMTEADIFGIAWFERSVKNYLRIQKLINKNIVCDPQTSL